MYDQSTRFLNFPFQFSIHRANSIARCYLQVSFRGGGPFQGGTLGLVYAGQVDRVRPLEADRNRAYLQIRMLNGDLNRSSRDAANGNSRETLACEKYFFVASA
jgi:hypothetical protein